MDSNIRSWIQLEIKDKLTYSQKDFYEIYYYFSQLIKYDIDKEGISGLTERLAPALSFASTQKMDRQDIVTYFPDIWGSFEVFVKKTLYLVNESAYKRLSKNSKNTLVNYLNELGFPVFVNVASRTTESDIIYGSYQLRNTESHEYNKWSLRRFYEELNTCLCGYMIVTNHVLQDLKTAFSKSPNFVQPQFNDFNMLLFLNTMFIYPLEINRLQGLKKITTPQGKAISFLEFDEEGKLISSIYNPAQGTPLTSEYTYTKEENKLIAKSDRDYREYIYNSDGQVVFESLYDKKTGRQNFIKCSEREIQYLEDGKILIINRKISTNSKNELYCSNEQQFTYDSFGNLLHIKNNDNTFAKYNYDSNHLISFKTSSQKHIDVKYLDEEVYFVYKEELLDGVKEITERHYHYENGILKSSKHFAPISDGKDTPVTVERIFEYY